MPTLPKPILELEGEVETTQTRQEPSFSGVFGAMLQLLWAGSHLVPNLYRRWTEPLELWWFNSWLLVSAPDQLSSLLMLQEERKEQSCHILLQIE